MTDVVFPAPRRIIVMGVSGSGKTTVGVDLASRMGWPFVDGDDLHSEHAVATMSGGFPLTDEDRLPWLRRIADEMEHVTGDNGGIVIACSALRRAYRDVIRANSAGLVYFVHLRAREHVLRQRLGNRSEHFMAPSLLLSQLQTLEPLEPDEIGCTLDSSSPSGFVAETVALNIANY